jgi:hypothetical protein
LKAFVQVSVPILPAHLIYRTIWRGDELRSLSDGGFVYWINVTQEDLLVYNEYFLYRKKCRFSRFIIMKLRTMLFAMKNWMDGKKVNKLKTVTVIEDIDLLLNIQMQRKHDLSSR